MSYDTDLDLDAILSKLDSPEKSSKKKTKIYEILTKLGTNVNVVRTVVKNEYHIVNDRSLDVEYNDSIEQVSSIEGDGHGPDVNIFNDDFDYTEDNTSIKNSQEFESEWSTMINALLNKDGNNKSLKNETCSDDESVPLSNLAKKPFPKNKSVKSEHLLKYNPCQKIFSNNMSLNDHKETTHSIDDKESLHLCLECQKSFETTLQRDQHTENYHSGEIPQSKVTFKCEKCDYTTDDTGGIHRHRRNAHYQQKDLKCPDCKRTFALKRHLLSHINLHQPQGSSKLKTCLKYKIKIIETNDLIIFRNELSLFLCLLCEFTSTGEDETSEHIAADHAKERELKCCSICHLELQSKTAVLAHWNEEHPGIESLDHVPKQEPNTSFLILKCTHCDLTFKNTKILELHTNRCHAEQDPYSCKDCKTSYKTFHLYKSHNQLKHPSQSVEAKKHPRYRCDRCNITYKSKFVLKDHMEKLHPEVELDSSLIPKLEMRCDQCLYVTDQPKNLTRHIEGRHMGISKFTCTKCKGAFADKRAMARHMRTNKEKDSDNFQCQKFIKIYPDASTFLSYNEGHNSFMCLSCNFVSVLKGETMDHIKKNHLQEPKVVCTKCHKFSDLKIRVIEHWNLCDGTGNPALKTEPQASKQSSTCSICKYEPDNKENFQEHIRSIHVSGKELSCNSCEETFARNALLVKHLINNGCQYFVTSDQLICNKYSSVTKKNAEVPQCITEDNGLYSCTSCPYISQAENLAHLHAKLKHRSAPRQNQYLCNLCETPPFKARNQVLEHISAVHGLETKFKDKTKSASIIYCYSCNECDYKTNLKGGFKKHVSRVHKKDRHFTCHECGKSYSEKCSLLYHLTASHGNILVPDKLVGKKTLSQINSE